mmetsp:Transcript_22259/g.66650  ORF Transcript_22259/g.66650 Transcript_22259/m.66650 type:complete len:243 (+) Transcript_22259:345-1073(+)
MSNKLSACRTSTLTLCKYSTTSGFSSAFMNSSRVTSPLPSTSESSNTCAIFTSTSCSRASRTEASSSLRCDARASVFCTITATTTCMMEKLVMERNTMKKTPVQGCSAIATRAMETQPSTDITWKSEYMLRGTLSNETRACEPTGLTPPISFVANIADKYSTTNVKSQAQTNVRAAAMMPSTRNHSSLKKRIKRKIRAKRVSRRQRRATSKSTLPPPPSAILRRTTVSTTAEATNKASNEFQ